MAAAMTMARQIAALPRAGVEGYKRIMADGLGTSFPHYSNVATNSGACAHFPLRIWGVMQCTGL